MKYFALAAVAIYFTLAFATVLIEAPVPETEEEPHLPTLPETQNKDEGSSATTTATTTTEATSTEDTYEPEDGPEIFCTDDCPLIDPDNPPSSPKPIEAKVREYYADKPVLVEIAYCESSFRQYDEEGRPLRNPGSTATGVMQIMASIHEEPARKLGYDIRELDGNLRYAEILYEQHGTQPWNASKGCWLPRVLARSPASTDSTEVTRAHSVSHIVLTPSTPTPPNA